MKTLFLLLVSLGFYTVRAGAVLPNYGYAPSSWLTQSGMELARYYTGATSNTRMAGTELNPKCFTYPIDLSGWSVEPLPSSRSVVLITPNWGISCAHSPPNLRDIVIFIGVNGVRYTNGIQSELNINGSDLQLIHLSNSVPSEVHPLALLPGNYIDYIDNSLVFTQSCVFYTGNCKPNCGTSYFFQAFTYRHNTDRFGVVWWKPAWASFASTRQMSVYSCTQVKGVPQTGVPPFSVNVNNASSGDSSSPTFILVNGTPVFLFALNFASNVDFTAASGPCPSDYINSISNAVFPDQLKIVDLSRYSPVNRPRAPTDFIIK